MRGFDPPRELSLIHPECHDGVRCLRLSLSLYLNLNRVSHEGFEALEPDDGKLFRPVLRGQGPSNGVRLLDPLEMNHELSSQLRRLGFLERFHACSLCRRYPSALHMAPVQLQCTIGIEPKTVLCKTQGK
jgi:hypothetical protein